MYEEKIETYWDS